MFFFPLSAATLRETGSAFRLEAAGRLPYNRRMEGEQSKRVSVVAPCYNEALVLGAFLGRVRAIADGLPQYAFEFVFVDDGSEDATEALLTKEAEADERVRFLCLSRNFGHQRAITAGLDHCTGDFIVVLDADLQDPPELIPEILVELEAGYDLVHTVRSNRAVDSTPKRISARFFYAIMRRWVLPELPENAGDYKGFNRRVLETLALYRERVRFLRGAFATLGFKQTEVRFVREVRHAGVSKYPTRNVLRFARDAIVSNTVLPLRVGVYLGLMTWLALPVLVVLLVALHLLGGGLEEPVLWLLLVVVCAFSGTILILLGLVGEYLKCIILETKQRPLYIVRALHNVDPSPTLRDIGQPPSRE